MNSDLQTRLIYVIKNSEDDKIFIGNTRYNIQSVFSKFKKASQRLDNSPLYRHMKLLGVDKFSIELLENCLGTSEYIKERIAFHIRDKKPTLNTKLYGTNPEELKARINRSKMNYYHKTKTNPERIKKMREYYEKNRENILHKRAIIKSADGETISLRKRGRPRKNDVEAFIISDDSTSDVEA